MSELMNAIETIFDREASVHARHAAVDQFRCLNALPANSDTLLNHLMDLHRQVHLRSGDTKALDFQIMGAADQAFYHLAIHGVTLRQGHVWVHPYVHNFFKDMTYGRLFMIGLALQERNKSGLETFPDGDNLYHYVMKYAPADRAMLFFNDAVVHVKSQYKTLSNLAQQWMVEVNDDGDTPLGVALSLNKFNHISDFSRYNFLRLVQNHFDRGIDLHERNANGKALIEQIHQWMQKQVVEHPDMFDDHKELRQKIAAQHDQYMLSQVVSDLDRTPSQLRKM